ncbi:hypothetical protein B0T25DRAFT_53841 [Lasiosphaeria hispida]|uniref:Uncharacterized protein n=1 Tax=Lasiosphaeria hispida TaxID=260671 RepID=A0AAJ0HVX1_9PEZI|nr:hypothetical protein B0T25DRAFT_53841 [Lasiosphaeria hispida]
MAPRAVGKTTTAGRYITVSLPYLPSATTPTISIPYNHHTVSPHDLVIYEPFMSAPKSSVLTDLTWPSIYSESPDSDSFEVSLNFGSNDFDAGAGDAWFLLFPPTNTQHNLPRTVNAEDSPAEKSANCWNRTDSHHHPPSPYHTYHHHTTLQAQNRAMLMDCMVLAWLIRMQRLNPPL